MARPLKDATQKRSIIAKVRLTAAEKKQIKDAAEIEGITISDLLRLRTLSTLPMRRKASPERAALIRGLGELGKLGSNINQIARNMNREQKDLPALSLQADDIKNALQGVITLSHHLVKTLESGH